jgi:hypothetical protein
LAPFWFAHHSKLFDHGVIIDYGCTDATLEIAKRFCPTWEIRKTRNPHFDAIPIDKEFMDIEAEFSECIKTVLNTTEFIFPQKPLREYFDGAMCLSFKAFTPVTNLDQSNFYPQNLTEMFASIESANLVTRYGYRHIHTHRDGAYKPGRHLTSHTMTMTEDIPLVWLGYWPWNTRTKQRKLQIKNKIGEDKGTGMGFHHFFTEERLDQELLKAFSESTELPSNVKQHIFDMCVKHDVELKDVWDSLLKRDKGAPTQDV